MSKIFGIHVPADLKNLAINGGLDFWQQYGATTTTVNTATTTTTYFADMFDAVSAGTTLKNYSMVRSTDVPVVASSGFKATYSSLFTQITAIAAPVAADSTIPFEYRMEGQDYARLHGKNGTFTFWVKPSVAGTYSFAIRNQALTRSYLTTFTVGAGSWQLVSITVPMDTNATNWNFDNTLGMYVTIGAVTGTTFQAATGLGWQTNNTYMATTATNWMATAGATLQVAMFSIMEGSLGPGQVFQRSGKDIQQELQMCQRYLCVLPIQAVSIQLVTNANPGPFTTGCSFPSELRVTPATPAAPTWSTSQCGTPSIQNISTRSVFYVSTQSATNSAASFSNQSAIFVIAQF